MSFLGAKQIACYGQVMSEEETLGFPSNVWVGFAGREPRRISGAPRRGFGEDGRMVRDLIPRLRRPGITGIGLLKRRSQLV